MMLSEYEVRAPSAAGTMNYRVTAKSPRDAENKVITLHGVLNWGLSGEIEAVDARHATP